MTQEELLSRLETEMRALLVEVRAQFTHLDPGVLQSRYPAESWNILECFAHLNQYALDYLPKMELSIHKAKARRWAPGSEVQYKGRGRRAIRRADPNNGKTYKASKIYNFGRRPVGNEIIKSFIINSERLLRVIQAARDVDINRASVKKAHAWIGRYTLANLLEFLVAHNRRHILQAQRLLG